MLCVCCGWCVAYLVWSWFGLGLFGLVWCARFGLVWFGLDCVVCSVLFKGFQGRLIIAPLEIGLLCDGIRNLAMPFVIYISVSFHGWTWKDTNYKIACVCISVFKRIIVLPYQPLLVSVPSCIQAKKVRLCNCPYSVGYQ